MNAFHPLPLPAWANPGRLMAGLDEEGPGQRGIYRRCSDPECDVRWVSTEESCWACGKTSHTRWTSV